MAGASAVNKTYSAKQTDITPEWFHVDADNHIVGRLATRLAMVLMGKHKPTYTANVDTGDFIVVTNVQLVRFSGQPLAHETHPHFTRKMNSKIYDHYTGYPSGRRTTTAAEILEKKPEFILREAVRRMLPKNKLGRQMLRKLKLFVGDAHSHQAQQPKEMPEHLLPKK